MMHRELNDSLGIENTFGIPDKIEGIGLISGNVEFKEYKILKRQEYTLYEGIKVSGFEMHTGISDNFPVFYDSQNIKGSMVHEIFHDDAFRHWWISNNSDKTFKKWNFSLWKKGVQNKVAESMYEIINWERMLG